MRSNRTRLSSPQVASAERIPALLRTVALCALALSFIGCQGPTTAKQPPPKHWSATPTNPPTVAVATNQPAKVAKRYSYVPRPYPVDERGFSPVDKALAKAYAREDMVQDDEEGSLNPYVLKVISAYPLDGSYPYHCGWDPREYDLYNGVTQDLWYKGMVVAKAYPDGSRCSYCCGFTFEAFVRAMKLRNVQKGLDPDDFNGMTFSDLFNMLQLWYIEGPGDCERRAITSYGLGYAVTNLNQVKPGDFLSYDFAPSGGHAVIVIDWLRDEQQNIVGLKYFSSNSAGKGGVGYGSSKFSDSSGTGRGIKRNSMRIARVGAIKDYQPFNRAEVPQRNAYLPTQPNRIIYVKAPCLSCTNTCPMAGAK